MLRCRAAFVSANVLVLSFATFLDRPVHLANVPRQIILAIPLPGAAGCIRGGVREMPRYFVTYLLHKQRRFDAFERALGFATAREDGVSLAVACDRHQEKSHLLVVLRSPHVNDVPSLDEWLLSSRNDTFLDQYMGASFLSATYHTSWSKHDLWPLEATQSYEIENHKNAKRTCIANDVQKKVVKSLTAAHNSHSMTES